MELQELVGKTCVIGVSYFGLQEELLKQAQYAGEVVQVDAELGITVRLRHSDAGAPKADFIVPPNLDPWFKAPPGHYKHAPSGVDIENLPPQDGYTLEGWLTGGGKAPVLVGPITPNASGIATLDTKLSGLPSYDYNMFVVAARKAGDTGSTLPADLSIAGRFTVIGDQSGAASGDVRPG